MTGTTSNVDAPTCPHCGRALESKYGGGWYCPKDTNDTLSTVQTHVLWILWTDGPLKRDELGQRLWAIYGDDFRGVLPPMMHDLEDRGLVDADGPANKKNPNYTLSPETKTTLEGDLA